MGQRCGFRMRWCKISRSLPLLPLSRLWQTERYMLTWFSMCRMIFLFRSGTVREKLALIFRATRTHAKNLAKYASVYKLTMLFLKKFGATPGKEGPYDTFFAGLLGGYLVFGRRSKRGHISSVSKQIVIFGKSLTSRQSCLYLVSVYGC
jgi:hypothetical protein